MRLLHVILFFVKLSLIVGFLWLVGLLLFINQVQNYDIAHVTARAQPVDSIVVLTGGSERLRVGLELLKLGKGKKLLVTGVHPGVTMEHILNGLTVDENLRTCCIVLGHEAESTEGNAEETQNWVMAENFHSLGLVTANYHMPRSLLLFRARMQEIDIIPFTVAPDSVRLENWWQHTGTLSLLITEYNKYLFSRFDLWISSL